jgi:uncharacterized membrane protein YbhN (UPF0104 family)
MDSAGGTSSLIGTIGTERLKKILLWLAKLAFSCAVLAWLAYKAASEGLFDQLAHQHKDWTLFTVAGFAMLATLLLQFARWRILATSLDLKLPLHEAWRLGFMGQTFSLLGVGMLGGDALKVVALARTNRGHATEAATSVFVDRVMGLYVLVVMAGVVCLFFTPPAPTETSSLGEIAVARLCLLAPPVAAVSTLALVALALPGVSGWSGWDRLARTPKVGPLLAKLVRALRLYRSRAGAVGLALALSVVIHGLNCLSFYCLSMGLPAPVERPGFLGHAAATLLALSAGALPVGGLELVFTTTFRAVSGEGMPPEQGFLVVMAYRALQLLLATIGLGCYLRGRGEVDDMLHQAQAAASSNDSPPSIALPKSVAA